MVLSPFIPVTIPLLSVLVTNTDLMRAMSGRKSCVQAGPFR